MRGVLLNVGLILLLIMISGVFVAAEMSLVSLRESQIRQLSHRGKSGQTVAKLTSNPNRFLSAVQIGVTLTGFLSAAYGGATLGDDLTPVLRRLGMGPGLAGGVALVLITLVISYASIVLGELTAKRLALQRSEAVAVTLAPMVDFIASLARPVIWLLGVSTNVVVRILGGDPDASREEVSDEEIRAMVSTSATLGDEERQIVDDVFAAGDRGLREVMVPRTEVDFLPGAMPVQKAAREISSAPHSRYPVTGASADDVLGFVHIRDLLNPDTSSRGLRVAQLARPVLSLPGTVRVLRALTEMRRSSVHLAIVLDEYGGTAGIVTMEDLVEELVGDINDEFDVVVSHPMTMRGEMDIDGLLSLDEFAEQTGFTLTDGPYDTVAGFFMARLGRLPQLGDTLQVEVTGGRDIDGEDEATPLTFTVAELDGRRAARFHVRRANQDPAAPPEPSAPFASMAAGSLPGAPRDAAADAAGYAVGDRPVGVPEDPAVDATRPVATGAARGNGAEVVVDRMR